MKQRFTSKQTSINSTKAPAVYSMKRAVDVMTGKTVVDIGGGRFDTAAEAARVYGAAVSIYDPFNRTPEHNAAVLAGSYDVAVISNVLNVIDSEAARGDVVRLAATKAAMEEAAVLAAQHSRAKDSAQVPVDYTQIRYVSKPQGAKPGMVIYVQYKTVYVDPTTESKAKQQS